MKIERVQHKRQGSPWSALCFKGVVWQVARGWLAEGTNHEAVKRFHKILQQHSNQSHVIQISILHMQSVDGYVVHTNQAVSLGDREVVNERVSKVGERLKKTGSSSLILIKCVLVAPAG